MHLITKLYFASIGLIAALLSTPAFASGKTLDTSISNVLDASVNLPGLVSVFAYLTGLALGVKGVLDLKKHVEMGPREMPIKTPIVELMISGALLALPFTYETLIGTITENGGLTFGPTGTSFYQGSNPSEIYLISPTGITTWLDPTTACSMPLFNERLGGLFCNLWDGMSSLPGLLSGFAYIAGLTMLYLGIVNIKLSVENPGQNSLWEPLQKILVAGLLLSLPVTLNVISETLADGLMGQTSTGFNPTKTGATTLDMIVGNFVFSIHGVLDFVLAGFGYIAGIILILIGIFRMLKTMQDGPRGPGGIGTIMTLMTGAALLALGPMMGAFATSFFGDNEAETNVDLTIPGGAVIAYEQRLENFIIAVIAYMMIVGWVSFIRGLFIFRQVAEGDQQSSMMSAVTHLIAGTLLVNLGPFLDVVQNTLGPIPGLPGLTFS